MHWKAFPGRVIPLQCTLWHLKKRIKILYQSHAQRKDITLMDGDVVQMRVSLKNCVLWSRVGSSINLILSQLQVKL